MSPQLQYLLDTNILSETRKKQANERVMSFLSAAEPSALFISVLSLGELRKGVALKSRSDPDAAKRLGTWVDGLEYSFGDRILGVDAEWKGEVEKARARLPQFRIGKYGQLQEWAEDYEEAEPGHRHISHLFALYPDNQITPRATPQLARAARVT